MVAIVSPVMNGNNQIEGAGLRRNKAGWRQVVQRANVLAS